MKIKNYSFVLFFVLLTHVSCNIGAENNQLTPHEVPTIYHDNDDTLRHEIIQKMLSWDDDPDKIDFNHYIQNIYNNGLYAQEFLPSNFKDLIKFLYHGKKTRQNRAYVQQVMRMFKNKLNASPWINADAFSQLLDELIPLLEPHFLVPKKEPITALHISINKIFSQAHELIKQRKPHTDIFQDLEQEIIAALDENASIKKDVTIEELRKTTLIFFEVALGKLVWSPEDSMDTWHSVKKISQQLTSLADCNVINDLDDLNGLYVTLLERYCYFIDLVANDLPYSFYHDVQEEVNASTLPFLTWEEQEELMETKRHRLHSVLHKAQQQAEQEQQRRSFNNRVQQLAQENGIIIS